MRNCKPGKSKKFTLVELLVVIAIISILAAMLLPALERARNSAQSVSCMNNMKQMGIAMISYGNDYDDYIPPASQSCWDAYANYRLIWIAEIHPYLTEEKWDGGGQHSSEVVLCPAGEEEIMIYNDKKITNYMFNAKLGHMDPSYGYPRYADYAPRKASKCPNPTEIGILADGKGKSCNTYKFGVSSYSTAMTFFDLRHSEFDINTLYADFHVAVFNIAQNNDENISAIYYLNQDKWPQ